MLWECQESKDGWTRSVVSTSPRGFCQERELGEMYIEVLRVPCPYVGELGGEGELGEEGRKETRELAFFPSFSFLPTRLVHPSRPFNPTSTRLTPLLANPSTLQPSRNASLTPLLVSRSSTLPRPPPRQAQPTNLTNPSLTSSLTFKLRLVILLGIRRGSELSSRSV